MKNLNQAVKSLNAATQDYNEYGRNNHNRKSLKHATKKAAKRASRRAGKALLAEQS